MKLFGRQYSRIFMKAGSLFVAALSLCGLASCGEDDVESHQPSLYDLVELTAHDRLSTTFTLYRADSDEPLTLKSVNPVDTAGTKIGESLFLSYVPLSGKPFTSGDIEVNYTTPMSNRRLKQAAPGALAEWKSDPVYLLSLWRAGSRIYVRARLTYDKAPRNYELIVDETTKESEIPDAYLFHRRQEPTPNFQRQYYVAFDISSLWNSAAYKGLRVHVNNSNNPSDSVFTILR